MGDSGGPVFRDVGGTLAVAGVVSWSTGPNMSEGCGGLTGVTPLTRYRAWIVEQAGKMGSALQ
jgi:secreted trypsin-like serine protease